jgi:hypothetical protein
MSASLGSVRLVERNERVWARLESEVVIIVVSVVNDGGVEFVLMHSRRQVTSYQEISMV